MSTIKLAKKYNFKWDATVRKILIKYNIPRRDRSHQRTQYELNENCFDIINTEEKAYFLGLLYADGGKARTCVYLSLDCGDRYILERLNTLLETDKPIGEYINNKGFKYARIEIARRHLVLRLEELGIANRKTYKIRFPQWLSENLKRHFIRGYFDGDGGLTIQKKRNKGLITITSNKLFCKDLEKQIEQAVDINCLVVPVKGKKIKRTVISGNKQILKFCDWLYSNANIYLTRKRNKYLYLKSNPISKQPKES